MQLISFVLPFHLHCNSSHLPHSVGLVLYLVCFLEKKGSVGYCSSHFLWPMLKAGFHGAFAALLTKPLNEPATHQRVLWGRKTRLTLPVVAHAADCELFLSSCLQYSCHERRCSGAHPMLSTAAMEDMSTKQAHSWKHVQ